MNEGIGDRLKSIFTGGDAMEISDAYKFGEIKEKIGFIGIGQMGGNMCDILETYGYRTLAINSSKSDLEYLKNVKFRYHIPGGEGCSKDRMVAAALLETTYPQITNYITEIMEGREYLFFVFASGGGTGSGAAPILMECVQSQNDKITPCAIVALPDFTESPKAHYNSDACFADLSGIVTNLGAVFTIDNAKGNKFLLNKLFVEKFNALMRIPTYNDMRGNLDNSEIGTLLRTRAGAYIATTNGSSNILPSIIKALEVSDVFCDIPGDKKVLNIGLSLTGEIPLDDIVAVCGQPLDFFTNYHGHGTNTVILTGMSFPESRIKSAVGKVAKKMDVLHANMENSMTTRMEASGSLDSIFSVRREKPVKDNAQDVLSAYDAIMAKKRQK